MAFTPKFEQVIGNNATTTLNGSINDSVTSLVVTSASPFPTDGNFRIKINSEIMLVTAVSGTTFTVERGAEGTTAAAHSNLDNIYQVVTAGGYKQFMMDRFPYFGEKPRLHWLGDTTDTELTLADFTWGNQGSATVEEMDQGGFAFLTDRTSGTSIRILRRASPSTPFTVTANIGGSPVAQILASNDFARIGIGFYESGTGKMMGIGPVCNHEISVLSWTDFTTVSTTDFSEEVPLTGDDCWLKIEDDGTNLNFSYSNTGIGTYTEVHTELRGSFFTTAPDNVMIWVNGRWGITGQTDSHLTTLRYWREE